MNKQFPAKVMDDQIEYISVFNEKQTKEKLKKFVDQLKIKYKVTDFEKVFDEISPQTVSLFGELLKLGFKYELDKPDD